VAVRGALFCLAKRKWGKFEWGDGSCNLHNGILSKCERMAAFIKSCTIQAYNLFKSADVIVKSRERNIIYQFYK
jgi:hypothetical protein